LAEVQLRRHLALVGLMGSGKTTVGRKLAARLGRPFIDADEALAVTTGRTVRQWFDDSGEAAFRAKEVDVLAQLLASDDPSVIATGGGIVCTEAGRALLNGPDVTVVWLRASPAFVANRVAQKANKDHRPLLDADPRVVLDRHAAERNHLYAEVADLVVDVDPVHRDVDKPKKKLAEMVFEAFSQIDAEKAARDRAQLARAAADAPATAPGGSQP